jgi:hypothetical protein
MDASRAKGRRAGGARQRRGTGAGTGHATAPDGRCPGAYTEAGETSDHAARLLIASNMVSAVGTGLVLPLTLIYLHRVRGIALPVVGSC